MFHYYRVIRVQILENILFLDSREDVIKYTFLLLYVVCNFFIILFAETDVRTLTRLKMRTKGAMSSNNY